MLKQLKLNDFKSHKESTLNFCGGLNAIIGLPDKGKSNLFKALLWIIRNRAPSDLIRWDTGTKGKRGAEISGTASAQVVMERGGKELAVSRTKGHEINQYKCGDEEFNTVNKEVPAEVARALNITDINIQSQFDGHYLLFDTGAAVASTFNKLTNLDKVDEVVSSLSSDLTKATQGKSYAEIELEKKQIELQGFAYLEELKENVLIHEDIEAELASCKADTQTLQTTITVTEENAEGVSKIATKISSMQGSLDAMQKGLEKLTVVTASIDARNSDSDALDGVIQDLVDVQERFKKIDSDLPTLNKELDLYNNQVSLVSDIEEKQREKDRLSGLVTPFYSNVKLINAIDDSIESKQKKVAEYTKEFELVDTCILCEQKLVGSAKEKMLENL